MNFTRKGDLYIPDEEPIAKGRSMVGYSRRSFFGLLAAFAAAPKISSLPWPNGGGSLFRFDIPEQFKNSPWTAHHIAKMELGRVTGGFLLPNEIAEELCVALNLISGEASFRSYLHGKDKDHLY